MITFEHLLYDRLYIRIEDLERYRLWRLDCKVTHLDGVAYWARAAAYPVLTHGDSIAVCDDFGRGPREWVINHAQAEHLEATGSLVFKARSPVTPTSSKTCQPDEATLDLIHELVRQITNGTRTLPSRSPHWYDQKCWYCHGSLGGREPHTARCVLQLAEELRRRLAL